MKFSNNFLILLSSVATFAFQIQNSPFTNPIQNDINSKYAITSITYDENADCVMAISNYKDCFGGGKKKITSKEFDSLCDAFLTKKCQRFYETGISGISECQSLSEKELLATSLKYENLNVALAELCSKDESGNYCPISKLFHMEINVTEKQLNRAITNTCKSKKCIDEAIEFTEKEIEYYKKLKELEDKITSANGETKFKNEYDKETQQAIEDNEVILNYLNSEKCSAKVANVVTSDASSIKYNNSLFIIFALILYTLI